MSLLRTKQSKKKPLIEDEISDTDDNVVYSSVNDRQGTTFKAASPANSRHAARLAKLAVAVQQDQPSRSNNSSSKSRFAALPSTAGPPRNQIEYPPEQRDARPRQPLQPAARHAPVAQHRPAQYTHQPVQTYVARDGREYFCNPEPAAAPYPPAAGATYEAGRSQYQQGGGYSCAGYQTVEYSSEIPAAAQYVGGANGQVAVPVARASWAPVAARRQADPLPDVTRYRSEQKTAYKVKSGSGRLRVSAPVGSSEAELFDAIAAANSRPPDADDRYEQSVVKSSSKGGWGLWKRTS